MPESIDQERFTAELFDILDETFENHHGILLDKSTSLFQTLDTINVGEASQPVGGRLTPLAANAAPTGFCHAA